MAAGAWILLVSKSPVDPCNEHSLTDCFQVIIIMIPAAVGGWIIYKRIKAKQAGLDPPPLSSYNPFARHDRPSRIYPASSSPIDWIKSKFHSLKGSRSSDGAYEPTGARRGADPDAAWDSRVGAEHDAYGEYYEDQELGLRPPGGRTEYSGAGYDGRQTLPQYGDGAMERGRSISREGDDPAFIGGSQRGLEQRFEEEMGHEDPFGDEAERSELRGVSPRPPEDRGHLKTVSGGSTHNDSPTERRSMFREQSI